MLLLDLVALEVTFFSILNGEELFNHGVNLFGTSPIVVFAGVELLGAFSTIVAAYAVPNEAQFVLLGRHHLTQVTNRLLIDIALNAQITKLLREETCQRFYGVILAKVVHHYFRAFSILFIEIAAFSVSGLFKNLSGRSLPIGCLRHTIGIVLRERHMDPRSGQGLVERQTLKASIGKRLTIQAHHNGAAKRSIDFDGVHHHTACKEALALAELGILNIFEFLVYAHDISVYGVKLAIGKGRTLRRGIEQTERNGFENRFFAPPFVISCDGQRFLG